MMGKDISGATIGPNHPLLSLPNVGCLPHIASAGYKTRTAMSKLAALVP